ncbi:MAG: hypothetical protein ACRCXZ_09605 [Patescibacteria group bacterium]
MMFQTLTKKMRIIKARTGSGKSTDLTWELFKSQGPLLSIQPRLQNVLGINSWMNQTGRNTGCVTGAHKLPTGELDYCTTGCAFNLIKSGKYKTIVFDEIQDATAETVNLLRISELLDYQTVVMSATVPNWCKNLTPELETTQTKPRNYSVNSKYGIKLGEVINSSSNVPFRNSLENVLLNGNALFFINGEYDMQELFGEFEYDINCILEQTNSQKLVVFRGTDDSAKLIKQVRENCFPNRGVLIITNVSLGTGVTIPNLKLIWDRGVVMRSETKFTPNGYRVTKWMDGITQNEAYQRSSRGGRTCNSDYYCGLSKNKLRVEPSFPLDQKEEEICEIAAYLECDDRSNYFDYLRKLELISLDNDLDLRLESKLVDYQVNKVFDGFNLFTNIKAPIMDKSWNYRRMINETVRESKRRFTFEQIDSLVKDCNESQVLHLKDYCPIQNRIYMLLGQIRNFAMA